MPKFQDGDRIVSPITIHGSDPEGYLAARVVEYDGEGMYILEEEDGSMSECHEDQMILLSEYEGVIWMSLAALEAGTLRSK